MDRALARIEGKLGFGHQPFHHLWCLPTSARASVSWQESPEATRSFPYVYLDLNTAHLLTFAVLGSLSKALATICTQPLIVAKVGLQSKPPPARNGVPFKTFTEVMRYIIEHEGPWALFKGIGPQILKGLLVQGFLMMTKERYVKTLQGCARDANAIPGLSFNSFCCSDTSAKYVPRSYRSWQTLQRRRLERLRQCSPNN